ncbi:MAG: Crp/Fnr family transcriptional regulator [Bacteroidales bacterium]|jgi:CRP-like cAMP-binding protein|nr:Crp/Fnr family transcriptional regulator [Bacteroidales bacterium]
MLQNQKFPAYFYRKNMDYDQLIQAPLFRGIKSEEIEKILTGIDKKFKKFKAGTLIVHSGDPVTSLIIVISGVVKGEMVDYSGRVIKIEDIPAPGALASAFLFGNKNLFPVNVVALSDTELMIIEKQVFIRLLMNNDIILSNFLDMISNRSQFLSEKIRFLNFKTIKGKLAQFILQRTMNDRSSFNLGMTQTELADYFAVARPSLSRVLGELEDEGLIEARGKAIKVIDRTRLLKLTSD